MRPWNTASAKSSKTMRQRFPTKRGNGFNIRRLGGCFIILLASTCCVRQANGRLSSISPRSISTCFASLGHRTCGFMTSEIRKNHRGGAECRHQRNHQGKGNVLLFPLASQGSQGKGPVQCRERLGGLLKYYAREAA